MSEQEFFIQGGYKWVTERVFMDNGVMVSENTHPVYDLDGYPVQDN